MKTKIKGAIFVSNCWRASAIESCGDDSIQARTGIEMGLNLFKVSMDPFIGSVNPFMGSWLAGFPRRW